MKSDMEAGRYEVITAINSFHGRTLGGLSATGQDKIKKGFFPTVDGFEHIPFNDLEAAAAAITEQTAAIMIEGIQGEGGIVSASPEYLLGLRKLCNDNNILLLWDGVQCGHFRSGQFQSYEKILQGVPGGKSFLPDAISMAKSLGGGFPMGAFWVREPFEDTLTAGYHGTTYGGNPMGAAVACKILEIIEREDLQSNVQQKGDFLKASISELSSLFPGVIESIRGHGLMLGIEISDKAFANSGSTAPPSGQMVAALHKLGVLTVPSGDNIVRLLPPYNITEDECSEFLEKLETAVAGCQGIDTAFNDSEAIEKVKENL